MATKWGFLRETKELAQTAGIDKDTGYHRTGLEDYLKVIFPDVSEDEWVHDKAFGEHNGINYRIRPDYRCDKLNLIIEFDGLPHYQNPDTILKDDHNQKIYSDCGYKVVRIPYFIQLTNSVVEQLFDVKVLEPLFPEDIPSMGPKGRNTPAYCCPAGLFRMALEIKKFPQQMLVNLSALKNANDEALTGYSMLMSIINTGKCFR